MREVRIHKNLNWKMQGKSLHVRGIGVMMLQRILNNVREVD